MMYELISLEQDLANKWIARVALGPGETVFFKFQDKPTKGDIDSVSAEYVAKRLEMNDGCCT